MTYTILTLTAAYALVVCLLAYLVLLSRLHWVFKLIATGATVAMIPMTFNGIGELRGLPSDGALPNSFTMLWAAVTEPNALKGEKGDVFLWLQAMDKDNYPVGKPRAYQLPYSDALKVKVQDAMVKISQGEEVQGKIADKPAEEGSTAEDLAQKVQAGLKEIRPGSTTSTVGERVYQFEANMLSFTPKAAPITPEKSP